MNLNCFWMGKVPILIVSEMLTWGHPNWCSNWTISKSDSHGMKPDDLGAWVFSGVLFSYPNWRSNMCKVCENSSNSAKTTKIWLEMWQSLSFLRFAMGVFLCHLTGTAARESTEGWWVKDPFAWLLLRFTPWELMKPVPHPTDRVILIEWSWLS